MTRVHCSSTVSIVKSPTSSPPTVNCSTFAGVALLAHLAQLVARFDAARRCRAAPSGDLAIKPGPDELLFGLPA
jgi:hypothetical protein